MDRGEKVSMGGEDATRALVRDVARRSMERLGEGVTRVSGETGALYRWLLAMLLLLNGAALYLSIGARDAIGPETFASAATLFFAGLMTALLAAAIGMAFTLLLAASMRRAIAHWTEVAMSGDLTDEASQSAGSVKRIGAAWLIVTSLMAFASLVLFLLGVAGLAERFGVAAAPQEDVVVLAEPTLANATLAPPADPANEAAAPAEPAPTPSPSPAAAPPPVARPAAQPPRPRATARPASAPKPAPKPSPKPSAAPRPTPVQSAPPPVAVPPPSPAPQPAPPVDVMP